MPHGDAINPLLRVMVRYLMMQVIADKTHVKELRNYDAIAVDHRWVQEQAGLAGMSAALNADERLRLIPSPPLSISP